LSAVIIPPLRAVHEDRLATGLCFDFVAQRPDEIGADQTDAVPQHFGMDRVIHQRGDGLAVGADRLNHAHPRVVEFGGVIVVGDLSLGGAGGDFQLGWFQTVERGVEGLGGFRADEIHVFEVAGVPAARRRNGERVAIGSAVRVRRADENIPRGNARHLRPHAVAQDRGKPEQVKSHHAHRDFPLAEDDRAGGQFPLLACDRIRFADAAADGQEGIGRDDAHGGPDFQPSLGR
jgi:hypothetical protein